MPYIKAIERADFAGFLERDWSALSAGQLNYCMTLMVRMWIGDPNYTKIALATGVLENVKQEVYRRLAGPYEDSKILENGDVY